MYILVFSVVKSSLCLRQQSGGSGARRSEAGAGGEEDGAAEGGVGHQLGVRREAKQALLFQTVAGHLQRAGSGGRTGNTHKHLHIYNYINIRNL